MLYDTEKIPDDYKDNETLKKIKTAKKALDTAKKENEELELRKKKVTGDISFIKSEIKNLTKKGEVMGKKFITDDLTAYNSKLSVYITELKQIEDTLSKLNIAEKTKAIKKLETQFNRNTYLNCQLALYTLIKKMLDTESVSGEQKKILFNLEKFVRRNKNEKARILMAIRGMYENEQ